MDLGNIDFTNLTLLQLGTTLVLFAALDTGITVILAVIRREFSPAYLLDFLRTHILKVATPILGLGIVGHGIAFGGSELVPAIPAASLAASASLAAYAVATIASIYQSFQDASPAPQMTGGLEPPDAAADTVEIPPEPGEDVA